MPADLPGGSVNALTVGLFNRLYYARIPRKGRERLIALERFFYPLDSILEWNRFYGRRGFMQFQCVLPDETAHKGLAELLHRITGSGLASSLAVIKTLGSNGRGCLSFPMRGVTLALDFPRTAPAARLLESLHAVTVDHGGRIYLAKDSCVSAAHLRSMYPRLPEFRAARERHDASRRWRSDMSARLGL
jgi:decaprenylphospho-beta-D-ribofuranose 2-oxidase